MPLIRLESRKRNCDAYKWSIDVQKGRYHGFDENELNCAGKVGKYS